MSNPQTDDLLVTVWTVTCGDDEDEHLTDLAFSETRGQRLWALRAAELGEHRTGVEPDGRLCAAAGPQWVVLGRRQVVASIAEFVTVFAGGEDVPPPALPVSSPPPDQTALSAADGSFIPPAAAGLPPAALDSATEGANRLDAWALDPRGRNFLAHALVQLARDGWLRPEPGEGFEPMRGPESAPVPAAVSVPPPTRADDRADVLNAAAQHLYTALFPAVYHDMGQKAAEGVNRAVSELRRMADEAQQQPEAERPRCPHCQLPHDLEPGSGAVLACASIRASIADRDAASGPGRVADEETGTETSEADAHPPTHAWKVESPRRGNWASWGATYDERDWARERYEDAIAHAPGRPFRLVRATTTFTVEAEHQPAADAQPVEPHPTEADLAHALKVLDAFQGRDANEPAVPVQPAAADTSKNCECGGSIPHPDCPVHTPGKEA